MLDVTIIGGGPAGLSAALVLARCRRSLVVVDAGQRRNQRARRMHNYLTRDGIPPEQLLELARVELARYDAQIRSGLATHAEIDPDGHFLVTLADGHQLRSRKLLLATGVRDILPRIDGFDECYGLSIHHCPYCDAWEHRDRPIVALGAGDAAVGLALSLRTWSPHITACIEGHEPSPENRALAARNNITVHASRVIRLQHSAGNLTHVHLQDGASIPAAALFFNAGQIQRSPLANSLGCRFKDDGGVETSDRQCTSIPGLYVAGDADKEVQFVIVAAAQGATAATAINRALQDEDRGVKQAEK